MNFIKNYKHLLILPAYGFFYLTMFSFLENRTDVQFSMIHLKIDDYIPFCEYFIVPYFLWFVYIFTTVIFFAVVNKNKAEYYRLIITLGIGMTLFLLISFLFPNGQDLRPETFTRENIFIDMVRYLYATDTSTNIFPSIHVFNSVACCIALSICPALKSHKGILYGSFFLTVLIIAATVFLRQHSIVDVFGALVLNAVCYQFIYKSNLAAQTAKKQFGT